MRDDRRGFSDGYRSIPFFYEPRVDALIAPLPLEGGPRFEPFVFGDYRWATVTRFEEFEGLGSVRAPRQPRFSAPGAAPR